MNSKPYPKRFVRKLSVATSLLSVLILPQKTIAQQTDENIETVTVTGTRALNRSSADSESPIDIISGKDLQSSGSTELATVLSRLLPSLNFPRPSGADGSDAVRPAQLKGLSPDQTLVLINGKRRHASAVVNVNGTQGRGSAPVDLNAIPLSAIDHIEVLRDGAAAQYGSDAIAGVINVILKKGAEGGEVSLSAGQYQESDGDQIAFKANGGIAIGDEGWLRIAAEFADADPTNRAGPDLRNPLEPRYRQVNQRYGDPESRPRNLFLNSEIPLTDDINFYAFANYALRKTSAAATWRTAFNGTALRTPLFPEGFLPLEESKSTDQSIVVGINGTTASDWRWDASLDYGVNKFDLNINNTVNVDLGINSPTYFHAGELENSQAVANVDIAKEFSVGALAGPLTIAGGVELRKEEYEISAGDPQSYFGTGSQGFSGFRPSDAGSNDRHNESVYLSAEASITEKLSGALAARTENYSDFGSVTSEKLSARYASTDAIAIRGTASNGFRAPSLAQQHYTITSTNFFVINGVNTPIETGTFGVDTAAAKALGAEDLKPEKSRNYNLGLQIQPTQHSTTTIDFYQIDIDDRILYSANLVLPNNLKTTLASQGVLVGAARYFTNAVDTRTRGVDIVSTYRVDINDTQALDLTLGYNRNKNTIRKVADSPALLTQNNLKLIDQQTLGRATIGSPKDKISLGADYTIDQWRLHALATRYGDFIVPQNNVALNQTYSADWVLDLSASYSVSSWELTGGVDNATDQYPDKTTSLGNLNTNGINPYSVWSPYGFNGRYYYAKAAYKW